MAYHEKNARNIKKYLQSEYDYFINLLSKYDVDIYYFAKSIFFDEKLSYYIDGFSDFDNQLLINAYNKLTLAFYHRFNIKLYLLWHDSEEHGTKSDQVDGAFWALEKEHIYTLTPEAEQLLEYINFKTKTYIVS